MQQVVRELAPDQLPQVRDARVLRCIALRDRRVDALDRDFTEMQVRRQRRGAVDGGQVARFGVVGDFAKRMPRNASRAPASPGVQCVQNGRSHAGFGGGSNASIDSPSIVTGRQPRRRIEGSRRPHHGRCRLPERREHLVRIAGFRRDIPRFDQQRAVVALGEQSRLPQGPLQRGVALFDRRLVTSRPEHRFGLRILCEAFERSLRRPAHADQTRASRAQRSIERRQRSASPCIRCSARRPIAFFLRRMHVHGNRRVTLRERRLQCGLVVEAEVVAEPDEGGRHARSIANARGRRRHRASKA